MANLIMKNVSKCGYYAEQSIQLSLIMFTEKLYTFHYYFGSSGLGPPRFDENPLPFRVQKEISLSLHSLIMIALNPMEY